MKKTLSARALALLLLIFAGNLFAADVAADFSAANKLYAEGKFADAADAYEKILQTGAQSPALLFNYANAEFKSGHLGKAIAAIAGRSCSRRATRNCAPISPLSATRCKARRSRKPLAKLVRLADAERRRGAHGGFFLADCWLCWPRGNFGPRSFRGCKNATRILFALTLFSGTVLGLQAANHFSSATAVVTAECHGAQRAV